MQVYTTYNLSHKFQPIYYSKYILGLENCLICTEKCIFLLLPISFQLCCIRYPTRHPLSLRMYACYITQH